VREELSRRIAHLEAQASYLRSIADVLDATFAGEDVT
jgi:hypothetical protein